jgi:glycosyltransferase involved in cell wall biosynthesis
MLGLPSDDLWIGFIGRLMGFKGVLTFIELARRFRRMHRSGVFVVVWDREFEPDVYEQVMKATKEGLIHSLEQRRDMQDIYPLFDVVVLPSTREGLPKTLMEAAACGIPAVAYDIPGCRDVIRHGVTGICVPKADVEALLASVSHLLERPDVRAEMGRQAVRLARNFFDDKRVHELIGNLYMNLLESVN